MINWQDDKDVFGRMFVLTGNPIFNNLRNASDMNYADLTDALSWGQLKSKRWLVETLECGHWNLETVFLCGGWYATLAAMMLDANLAIKKIRSFDIDPLCESVAETVNKHHVKDDWRFKASTLDIHDLRYDNFRYTTKRSDGSEVELTETPNTIINTSCEHIENFAEWYAKIPNGKLVVLQSNDYFEVPDHINCSADLDTFSKSAPMSDVKFEGELFLSNYTRFMKIGYK